MSRAVFHRVHFLALAGAAALAPAAVGQTTYTWSGNHLDNNWASATNWVPQVVPPNNGTALLNFNAFLGVGYVLNQNIADPYVFQGIVSDTSPLTLSGSSIKLASVQTGTGAITLNTAIVGAGSEGTLTCSSTTTTPVTLNGALTGLFSLNVASGTTVLGSGSNSYLGTTVSNSSTLRLAVGTALPTGGTVTVTGGTLDIGVLSNSSGTAVGRLNLLSGGKLQVGASGGDYHLASLGLDGGAVTDGGSSSNFWLHLRSPAGITTGTSSGLTSTIGLAGTSRIQNDSGGVMTFSVAGGNTANGIDLDIGAIVFGGGSGGAGFVKSGAGTLRLTNASNSASFTVSQGLLQVDSPAALGSGQLTLNGGGLRYAGTANATISAAVPFTATSTIEVTNAVTLNLTGNNTYNSNFNNYSAGLVKTGPGALVLTNAALAPTFGSTTVAGGSLTMNASPGTVNLQAGSLALVGNSPLTASLTGAVGTTLILSSGVLLQDTNTTPATFAGTIAGAGGLFVGSGGTVTTRMVLSGANTFTGGLTVGGASYSGGTVALGTANALSSTGAVVVQGGSTLDLTNAGASYSQTVGSFVLGSGSTLNLGSATLTLGDATNKTLAGTVTGSGGSLVKTGAGTLTLSGTNTYTGGTTVADGAVSVATDANLGGQSGQYGPVTVLNAGQLVVTGTSFTTSRQFNLGVSTLAPAAGGSITFSRSTVTGGTLTGTLATASGLGSTFVGVTIAPSATLQLGGADTLTNSTLGGATTVLASGFTPALSRTTNTTSGRLVLNGGAQLVVTDFVNNGVLTIPGGQSPGRVTNTGGDLYLGGGSRTTLGTKAAPGGTLDLAGGNVQANGGFLYVNSPYVSPGVGGVQNGTVFLNYGSVLKGTGFVDSVSQGYGSRLDPGNSPGTLTVGTYTINGGTSYTFEINKAVDGRASPAGSQASAGQDPGWDLTRAINANPATPNKIVINATSAPGDQFTISVTSLKPDDTAGPVTDFDRTKAYRWLAFEVADAGGQVSGFSADKFAIDASAFTNALQPGDTFGVELSGNDIYLTFTPVPEPATVGLLGVVGLGAAAFVRRRLRIGLRPVQRLPPVRFRGRLAVLTVGGSRTRR